MKSMKEEVDEVVEEKWQGEADCESLQWGLPTPDSNST